jgi:hypothetical protein
MKKTQNEKMRSFKMRKTQDTIVSKYAVQVSITGMNYTKAVKLD